MLCSSLASCSDFEPVVPQVHSPPHYPGCMQKRWQVKVWVVASPPKRFPVMSKKKNPKPQLLSSGLFAFYWIRSNHDFPLLFLLNKQSAPCQLDYELLMQHCWIQALSVCFGKNCYFQLGLQGGLPRGSAFSADPRWAGGRAPAGCLGSRTRSQVQKLSTSTPGWAHSTLLLLLLPVPSLCFPLPREWTDLGGEVSTESFLSLSRTMLRLCWSCLDLIVRSALF